MEDDVLGPCGVCQSYVNRQDLIRRCGCDGEFLHNRTCCLQAGAERLYSDVCKDCHQQFNIPIKIVRSFSYEEYATTGATGVKVMIGLVIAMALLVIATSAIFSLVTMSRLVSRSVTGSLTHPMCQFFCYPSLICAGIVACWGCVVLLSVTFNYYQYTKWSRHHAVYDLDF